MYKKNSNMKERKCAVCGSVSPPIFGFPSHPEKCKLWLKLIHQHTGQNIEIKDFKNISKRKFICDVHFGDWCFTSTGKKRLLPGARPFVNECPYQTSEPQMFNTFANTSSPSVTVGESRNHSLILEEGSDNTEMDNTPAIRTETDLSVKKQWISKSWKINTLQRQVSKLRRQLLLKDKRMAKGQMLHMLQTKLNHNTYWFVMGQLMASARQPNGRRWTPKEKSMYLNIYFQSPSSYRLISRIIPVPCRNTLIKSITGFVTSPGFCLRLLATLKKIGESMSPQDKYCSLVFGEVNIKSGIKYDSKFDVVVGFESYGAKYEVNNHTLATHALVFMIRGLSKSWKQPFGFFLTSDTIPISIFKSLVLDAIDLVTDAGFTVVCLVCDQSSTNQGLFRDLKVSITKPFYLHRQQKIFMFYNPPDLLKSVRNNFKKYNVAFDKGDVAKWEHVERFYNLDSKNKYRIVPRLSKCQFTNMKVKHAAQVFSSSVAGGISLLVSIKTLSSEANYTADFISKMGDLFDSFNSRTLKESKQMAAGVTHDSKHEQYWKDTLEWVKSWKFIKNDGKPVQPLCKKGWILTISAVLQLRENLKSSGFGSLCTNRLNQDCLENTFSMIRGKAGFRANPDSYRFISTFHTVLVHNLIKPSNYTDCENDTDELLSDLFRNYTFTPCMFQTEDTIDGNSVALPNIEEIQINTVEENMSYISGYLARKIISLMGDCSCCESLLTVPSHLDVNTMLLHFKEYDKTQPKLKCPSENLIAAITRFTALFFLHFDTYLYKENISRTLYSILNEVEMDWLNDHPEHSIQMKDFLIKLYLKMMIISKVKEINKSL